mgnify:CR=1 FL=1
MPKRELQIPVDKTLNYEIKEELVFRSPATIPDKGIRDLIATKKILGSNCSYYDIAPTENQSIKKSTNVQITIFPVTTPVTISYGNETQASEIVTRPGHDAENIESLFNLKLGEINE